MFIIHENDVPYDRPRGGAGLRCMRWSAKKAGATKDEQAAKAAGQVYEGDGPAERAGAAEDRINRAESKARKSQADALEDQGRALRAKADADAKKLEHQADELRAAAKTQADALKQ